MHFAELPKTRQIHRPMHFRGSHKSQKRSCRGPNRRNPKPHVNRVCGLSNQLISHVRIQYAH